MHPCIQLVGKSSSTAPVMAVSKSGRKPSGFQLGAASLRLEGHPVGLLGFVLQEAKDNRNVVFRFCQENPDDEHLNPALWSRGKCPIQEGDGGVVQLGQVLLGGKNHNPFSGADIGVG